MFFFVAPHVPLLCTKYTIQAYNLLPRGKEPMKSIKDMFLKQQRKAAKRKSSEMNENIEQAVDKNDDVIFIDEQVVSPHFTSSDNDVKLGRSSSIIPKEQSSKVKAKTSRLSLQKMQPLMSPPVELKSKSVIESKHSKVSSVEHDDGMDINKREVFSDSTSTTSTEQSGSNMSKNCSDTAAEKNSSNKKKKTSDNKLLLNEDEMQTIAQNKDEVEVVFRIPYYLQNFETVLNSVLEDQSNNELFNCDDSTTITAFKNLSDEGKKLYVRLFSRKHNWIHSSKINYPEIADDLNETLNELVNVNLIVNERSLNDLETVLNALSAPDVKSLSKTYHIAPNQQKHVLVKELIKKTQQNSISSMFGSNIGGMAKAMLTRAKKLLHGVFRLLDAPRKTFIRIMILFSLVSTSVDDDEGNGGQSQLFQMLMVNMGKVIYPQYTINKVHRLFKDRDDILRFEQSLQLESDMLHCVDKNDWPGAYSVYCTAVQQLDEWEQNDHIVDWNKSLPDFLRTFTATSVLYRLLNTGVDILQRRKDFTSAVELLRKLLKQELYSTNYRGFWWERLALNLDVHLKKSIEALKVVENGLADVKVQAGRRLALFQRAEAICARPKLNLKEKLAELHHKPIKELPKVYVEGRVLHQDIGTTGSRFLTSGSFADGNSEEMTVCGVEEFVLDYYKNNGYPSGLHAEGSIVTSLFGLFLWDIIFTDLPDAFHSPFQAQPLDLYSDSFYSRRKDMIEERLTLVEKSSVQELQDMVASTWEAHHGELCVGLNWDRFENIQQVQDIVMCMGRKALSGILSRHARCPRHTRSGFPDLTLWNSETGAFKICEVKGPGDRLSHKQILWIDYLLDFDIDAEVCHVKAVSAKKLKAPVSK